MSKPATAPDDPTADGGAFEKDVLGQMLSFELYDEYVVAGVQAEWFVKDRHRVVFEAVATVHGRGLVADVITVTEELRRRGQLRDVGEAVVVGLTSGQVKPTPANIAGLVRELRELHTLRQMHYGTVKLQEGIATATRTSDLAPLSGHLTQLEAILAQDTQADDVLTADAQLEAYRREIARSEQSSVFFGFPTLDKAIEGIRPGEVCGIMARPGLGKTLLLCAVARYVGEMDVPHVFFSLEMPAAQIVERLQRSLYGLGRWELKARIENNLFQHDDAEEYRSKFRRQLLVATPSLSIAEMSLRVRRATIGPLRGDPVRLVTVDHLGLIGGDRKMNTYDRVSTQARELKELAKRYNLAVLLAIQVNRDAGGDGARELGLGAARDSGVVEEAMDYLIAARRLDRSETLPALERERYRDVLFLKVVKNRRESPMSREIAIRLDPKTLELTEDPDLRIEEDDMAAIARTSTSRRR